jgi:hypothetical protein
MERNDPAARLFCQPMIVYSHDDSRNGSSLPIADCGRARLIAIPETDDPDDLPEAQRALLRAAEIIKTKRGRGNER